jgi:two-component system, NarL family, response regulator YdfI
MKPIRVMITDDHLIIREGLRLILETAEGIDLVGEASNGAECLRLVPERKPDVILMDLQMPRMDGITAIGHLRSEHPEIAIVILTTFNEDDLMLRGLQAGARLFAQGYQPRKFTRYHPGGCQRRDIVEA